MSANLLPSGDFEASDATASCGDGWIAFQATAGQFPLGKDSAHGCKFCGESGVASFTIDSPTAEKAISGAKYHGHAWFQRLGAVGPMKAELKLRAWNFQDDRTPIQSEETTVDIPLDANWHELVADLELPASVPDDYEVDAYVNIKDYGQPTTQPCGLTDRIEIVRVTP